MDMIWLWLSSLFYVLFSWWLNWKMTMLQPGYQLFLDGPFGQPGFAFLKDDDECNLFSHPLGWSFGNQGTHTSSWMILRPGRSTRALLF
ncbi:hypothetical protein MA16_Dca025750 [Dendrobium catenatum]|uniref:Uncharacterized protein n=1 Tax=Dendrobium catenatum TaxID=906689 RepID=A0A2I0VE40_9ASPA|nr:hypothetical protein MA16_Dca025750 [Dendrobium catenatum]